MTTSSLIDPSQLRNALGSFATGVTVITCLDAQGEPTGATASSFNSVSMDPPLILWSITKTAYCAEAFLQAKEFAVNVLSVEQVHLSNQFARSGEPKFTNVETINGLGNVPILADCTACLQCRTWNIYDGGDHKIIVGEVVSVNVNDKRGLLFYRGEYHQPAILEK